MTEDHEVPAEWPAVWRAVNRHYAENGMAKRTKLEEYTQQTRGGKGRINYNLTDKTGEVVGMSIVHPEDELYIITASGIIMVTGVSDISQIGRNTQGVKAISLNEGDKVTGIATVEPEDNLVHEPESEA